MSKIPIDIATLLPHRTPMLMVDTILEISENSIVTQLQITENNIFLDSGFFSEAGLTEHCAQSSATILGNQLSSESGKPMVGFIASIKKLEIFSLPEIGKKIVSRAALISKYENICQVSCETLCDEKMLLRAEISMMVQEI